MKRIIAMAVIAASFAACDTKKSDETTVTNVDTTATVMADESTVRTTYMPAEGDVTYRNGKVMVYRTNDWVLADKDVSLEDGIVVYRNGDVKREDKVVRLEEGETVSKTGKFFNKVGEGIEDGWDATKKGVGKAADAVKKAGQKVGEAAKKVVD